MWEKCSPSMEPIRFEDSGDGGKHLLEDKHRTNCISNKQNLIFAPCALWPLRFNDSDLQFWPLFSAALGNKFMSRCSPTSHEDSLKKKTKTKGDLPVICVIAPLSWQVADCQRTKKKKNSRQLPQHYQLRVFPLFTLMDDRMTGHRTYSLLHTTVTVITADAWAKQSDTFQMSLFKTSRTSHQRERERQTLDTSQQRWELIRIYRFWFHY